MAASFLLVWIAGGATCQRRGAVSQFDPPPMVFTETPTLEQVVAAVNRSDAVTKLQSTSATVEMIDSPMPISRLDASLALERPRRLSLRADLPVVLAPGFNVGSNDEVFWMQYPEGLQLRQTLVYARHEEFQRHMVGSPLPVDPTWIIQALGLVHIDPALVVSGPTPLAEGKVELRTRVPTASGEYTRVLIIDASPTGGFVRELYLYSPDGSLVAKATGAEHQYYKDLDVVLPHSVQLQLQPNGAPPIGLKLEIGSYVLNQLLGSDPRMFEMPAAGNHQVIDLSKLRPILPPAGAPPLESVPSYPVGPSTTYVPAAAAYVPPVRGMQMR